jgi:5-(carboxyamino)imidazole ribonucleotide synthase
VITPPATIGMLGGGQLGRYSIIAARLAGYRTIVLDPDAEAPAARVADIHLVAAFDDAAALDELATRCAVVTTEFENPPASALQRLAADVVVSPPPAAVAIAQDRLAEKSFLDGAGFPVAPSAALVDTADLRAVETLGGPLIVKTARFGYDGKGQRSADGPAQAAAAWDELGRVPCCVERRLPLDAEVSVIVARRADGATATYPVAENLHRDGILDLTVVPAGIAPELAAEAQRLATRIAEALGYAGMLAVELFVSGGRLLVNELAPRPHNSGHWTLDAAVTSQFAQHVRAVTGAALGPTAATVPAVAMVNLLGELWFAGDAAAPTEPDWSAALADPGTRLHLYGKAEPRRRRKMGHLTVLGDDVDEVVRRALRLRQSVVESRGPGARASSDDGPMRHLPDRIAIVDGSLVLRRHRPGDVDTLHAVIEASREHLRPFMPWADQDRVSTATFLVKAIEDWERADSFNYLVTEPAPTDNGERLLGACGLHKRGAPNTIEIGYWLRPEATGRGTMTAAAEALAATAFGLEGVDRVEIHCDEANERSAAIPRRLGFRYDGVEVHDPAAPGETGRRQVWVRERSA